MAMWTLERKPRLLFVEDDIDIASMLRIYFTDEGAAADVAYKGREVFEKFSPETYDLFILDIQLPDYDGFSLARKLREKGLTTNTPFVFLTQRDERADRLWGLEIGADDYITKPFDIEELKFRLKVALRHRENILHFLSEKEQEETIPVVMEHKQRSSNHFFISYSHEDKVFAQALFAAFVRYNIPVWMDEMIGHGHKWQLVLQKKIGTCKGLILIMSENSHRSLWVQNEVAFAQSKKKKIFPLLLDGEVPLSVAAIQYIDVTNRKLPPDSFFKACYELTHKKEKK